MTEQHPFSLAGKVAIITGASKGIGESIAQAYAQAGAKVVVNSRKQEAVDEVAAAHMAADCVVCVRVRCSVLACPAPPTGPAPSWPHA